MVRGPATTQTHWINSTAGASPPSACLVGLSAATGSDQCHAVTRNVPIQAQHLSLFSHGEGWAVAGTKR